MIFPVSVAIYRRIAEYRAVLESCSATAPPAYPVEPTGDGNLRVLNDTAGFYRFFDAARHAECLYACVEQVIEQDMPEDIRFLEGFERFSDRIQQIVDP